MSRFLYKAQKLLIWYVSFLMFSCTHEAIVPNSDCIDFDIPGISFGPDFAETGLQYKAPCYNPNNSNEFIYIEELIDETAQLVIYNCVTKEKKVIVNDSVNDVSQPNWVRHSLVAYNSGLHVYVVNLAGADNTKVGNGVKSWFPEWIHDDNVLTFVNFYSSDDNFNDAEGVNQATYNFISNTIDTFTIQYNDDNIGILGLGASGIDNDYFTILRMGSYFDNLKLALINSTTHNVLNLVDISETMHMGDILCVQWHPNNHEIYFTHWYGNMYKVDIETGISTVVLESCDSKWYNRFSISPDGTKMLVEKVNCVFNGLAIYMNSTIVEYNIDGSGEKVILE